LVHFESPKARAALEVMDLFFLSDGSCIVIAIIVKQPWLLSIPRTIGEDRRKEREEEREREKEKEKQKDKRAKSCGVED
jgi:hypothetical protein